MKKKMIIAASILAVGLGAAGATSALAAGDGGTADQMEIQALGSVKLSMVDAIKAAEAAQPGKTAETQFDLENGMPAYEITVIAADGTEHNLMVDANTGKVEKLATNEDKAGQDGDGHEDGEAEDGDNG